MTTQPEPSSYSFLQTALSLCRKASTCPEAPPSVGSHPSAKPRPSRSPSLRRPPPHPFRGTVPQYGTAAVGVYQNPSVQHPSVCSSHTMRPPPQSDSAGHCDPSSQRDSSPQCGPALISVTPLRRFRPPPRRNPECPLRLEEELQLASFKSALGPECAGTAHPPYPTLPVLRWLLPPGVGEIANYRQG